MMETSAEMARLAGYNWFQKKKKCFQKQFTFLFKATSCYIPPPPWDPIHPCAAVPSNENRRVSSNAYVRSQPVHPSSRVESSADGGNVT